MISYKCIINYNYILKRLRKPCFPICQDWKHPGTGALLGWSRDVHQFPTQEIDRKHMEKP